ALFGNLQGGRERMAVGGRRGQSRRNPHIPVHLIHDRGGSVFTSAPISSVYGILITLHDREGQHIYSEQARLVSRIGLVSDCGKYLCHDLSLPRRSFRGLVRIERRTGITGTPPCFTYRRSPSVRATHAHVARYDSKNWTSGDGRSLIPRRLKSLESV